MCSGLVASAEKPTEITIANSTGNKLTVKFFSTDNNGINTKAIDSKELPNETGLTTDFQGKCARFIVETGTLLKTKKAYKVKLKDTSAEKVTIEIDKITDSKKSDVFKKNDKVKIDYLGNIDWSKDKNKNIGATCQ